MAAVISLFLHSSSLCVLLIAFRSPCFGSSPFSFFLFFFLFLVPSFSPLLYSEYRSASVRIDVGKEEVLVEASLTSHEVQGLIGSTGRRAVLKGIGGTEQGKAADILSDMFYPFRTRMKLYITCIHCQKNPPFFLFTQKDEQFVRFWSDSHLRCHSPLKR